MCDYIHFLEMVHGTSVSNQGSVPNNHSSFKLFQVVEVVKEEIVRISEKIKENLNLLREE